MEILPIPKHLNRLRIHMHNKQLILLEMEKILAQIEILTKQTDKDIAEIIKLIDKMAGLYEDIKEKKESK